jgi:hypothetical protein
MQQIADWLEKLGMPEYSERFSENKIDVSVLRHLTDEPERLIVFSKPSRNCPSKARSICIDRKEQPYHFGCFLEAVSSWGSSR